VTVAAQGGAAFQGGPAEAQAEGIILERGQIVDTQEWTRQVAIVAGAPTLQGKAKGLGSGRDNASLRIKGHFTATAGVSLDLATLTIASLLDEVAGAGELVRGAGGVSLLPLTLSPRKGAKLAQAIYETASGVRPSVRAEVKSRDPETGHMEFSVTVDRATVPRGPAHCSTGDRSVASLLTRLSLQGGGGAPVGMEITVPWRCAGTELKTP
jgi:hypothetical protein